MKTIAIIEDDQAIGDLLEEVLQKEGYAVRRAYSGTEAVYLLSQQRPDLALLDLMLPGLSGEEVLPHLEGIPVIVVSAKVGVDDKVKLLLGGAADYLTKPFEIPELLARIQVQLRKSAAPLSPVLWAGDVELDTASRQVTVGGTPVHLTKTEYAILKLLLQNPGQAVAKSVILERISLDTLLPEAAREQPAEKAAGGRGQGVHPGGVGHWVPAERGGRGKILTESLPFS